MGEKIVYTWNGETIGACRSCGAAIWFKVHERTGGKIPITRKTGEPHFAVCPDAANFRKKQKRSR